MQVLLSIAECIPSFFLLLMFFEVGLAPGNFASGCKYDANLTAEQTALNKLVDDRISPADPPEPVPWYLRSLLGLLRVRPPPVPFHSHKNTRASARIVN